MKIFLIKSESFLTLHRQQRHWHIQGPKGSKDIVKRIYVKSVVNLNFMKLREYILCTKNYFIQQFVLYCGFRQK